MKYRENTRGLSSWYFHLKVDNYSADQEMFCFCGTRELINFIRKTSIWLHPGSAQRSSRPKTYFPKTSPLASVPLGSEWPFSPTDVYAFLRPSGFILLALITRTIILCEEYKLLVSSLSAIASPLLFYLSCIRYSPQNG